MEQVKVSIIIPVYNAETYLQECLDSLISQSLSEWEAICIDDYSTDESPAILEQYQKRDKRIRVICNDMNVGASASRNKGLEFAKGKYVQFVDADDYLEQTALEELYLAAEIQDADMSYLRMEFQVENAFQASVLQCSVKGTYKGVFTGTELIKKFVEQQEFFLYLWSVFYRTSFIRQHKLMYKSLRIGEGGNFILRALCQAQRVIVLDGRHYHYRVHEKSITHGKDAKKELLVGQIVQYIDVLKYFSQNEKAEGLYEFLRNQYRKIAGGIQCLSECDKKAIEEKLDTPFEKSVFDMLLQNSNIYGITFDDEMIARIRKKESVIIYGAGYASKEVIEQIHKYGIEVVGFAVTKRTESQKSMYGHHVYEIQELKTYHDKAIILVASNQKYNQEIEEILYSYCFEDIIFLNVVI